MGPTDFSVWNVRGRKAAPCCFLHSVSMLFFSALFITVNNVFFLKKKPVQWIDFTRAVHVNVNSNFVFEKLV